MSKVVIIMGSKADLDWANKDDNQSLLREEA